MNALFGDSDAEGLPAWLREVMARGFNSGFSRKLASEAAIESLTFVDKVLEKECPICYEKYEQRKPTETVKPHEESKCIRTDIEDLLNENATIVENTLAETMRLALRFNDPSIFMPTDESAVLYQQMPQRSFHTLEPATLEQVFPGYGDDDELKEKEREQKQKELQMEGHIAVKMPNCKHVFGKSCIIEWLKNNVSCPLCREEVEATVPGRLDPRKRKLNDIRSNIFHRFNDSEAMTTHLINNLTDVFQPYSRPFNPRITPLTELFMPSEWAGGRHHTGHVTPTPDPDLMMPGRYPFPHSVIPRRMPTRSRRRSVVSDGTPMDDADTANDDEERATRVHFSPHTTTIGDLNTSASDESPEEEETTHIPSPSINNNPLGSPGIPGNSPGVSGSTQGAGGPERSRRGGNRTHPYVRNGSTEP